MLGASTVRILRGTDGKNVVFGESQRAHPGRLPNIPRAIKVVRVRVRLGKWEALIYVL